MKTIFKGAKAGQDILDGNATAVKATGDKNGKDITTYVSGISAGTGTNGLIVTEGNNTTANVTPHYSDTAGSASTAASATSATSATKATGDANGVAITSYVKSVAAGDGVVVVTDGAGNPTNVNINANTLDPAEADATVVSGASSATTIVALYYKVANYISSTKKFPVTIRGTVTLSAAISAGTPVKVASVGFATGDLKVIPHLKSIGYDETNSNDVEIDIRESVSTGSLRIFDIYVDGVCASGDVIDLAASV